MTDRVPDPATHDAAPAPDARVRRFLQRETVLWLTTACEDGRPHLVPVWFLWDGQAILVFSKPHAVKVRCLRDNPRAMIALGDATEDFDVGLIEAHAELLDAPASLPREFVAKYERLMPRGGLDPETFATTYTQAIRLTPTRFLPWHGRSPRALEAPRLHLRERLAATVAAALTSLVRGTRGGGRPAPDLGSLAVSARA